MVHTTIESSVSLLTDHWTMCGGCWSPGNLSGPTCSLYPNPVAQAYGSDFGIERVKLTKDIQMLLLAYCQSVDLDGKYLQDTSDTLSKSQNKKFRAIVSPGAEEQKATPSSQSSRPPHSIHNSRKTQLCRCERPQGENLNYRSARFISEEAASPSSDDSPPAEVVRPIDIFMDLGPMDLTNPHHKTGARTLLYEQQPQIQKSHLDS